MLQSNQIAEISHVILTKEQTLLLNKQLLTDFRTFFTTCFSSRNFIPLEYDGPQLSRQKQKHHGKTKNLTAKTKYLTAKPKTSRQNQILHSKSKIALVLPWVFAFAVRYLVFAVKYLVLPWGLWFCREGFGFAVTYFFFAVRFLVLPWQLWATVYWTKLKILLV